METMLSSLAWDVPYSNLVVNLKKMKVDAFRWSGQPTQSHYYVAGVSIRKGSSGDAGYMYYNVKGDDEFSVFESLMARIDKSASVAFGILDAFEATTPKGLPLLDACGWDSFPPPNSDFTETCFASLSRMTALVEKQGVQPEIRMYRKMLDRGVLYSVFVSVDNEIVFKGRACADMSDAFGNARNAYAGALALLDKFRSMSWSVMLDSSHPEYEVMQGDRGTVLKKKDGQENHK